MKKKETPKLIDGKCKVCNKCKIIADGPMKGYCIYGGPFSGFKDESGTVVQPKAEHSATAP